MKQLWSDRIILSLQKLNLFNGIEAEDLPQLLNWLNCKRYSLNLNNNFCELKNLPNGLFILCEPLDIKVDVLPPFNLQAVDAQYSKDHKRIFSSNYIRHLSINKRLGNSQNYYAEYIYLPIQNLQNYVVPQGRLALTLQRFFLNLSQFNQHESDYLHRRMQLLLLKNMRAKLSLFFWQIIEDLHWQKPVLKSMASLNAYLEDQEIKGRYEDDCKEFEAQIFEIKLSGLRQDLARYLAVTRSSMCRELSNLQQEGILEVRLNRIRILNVQKLKTIAQIEGRR